LINPIPNEDWLELHHDNKVVSTNWFTYSVGQVSEENASFSFWGGVGFIVAGGVFVALAAIPGQEESPAKIATH